MQQTPGAGRLYDELLVTLVQSGDRAAGERLGARWQPRLLRTARRLLRDEDMARSVVQESWLAIWRGLPSLRDPARFPGWAFAILHRRSADAIRQAQRRRGREGETDSEPAAPDGSPNEGLDIRQAFTRLPADQRLAAQLYYVEGLTLDEIAEAQGVPLGTAKTRLFHARLKLKAALEGEDR